MGKKLLSKDYDNIVCETLNIPLSDFYDYYLNIVNEHYSFNVDIIEKLTDGINRGIEWYRQKRGYHSDESGNKILCDQDKRMMPLYPHSKIYSHIDKSFFDLQIEMIERIRELIDLYDNQREAERLLPPEAFNDLNSNFPFPAYFDLATLRKRFDTFIAFKNEFFKRSNSELNEKEGIQPCDNELFSERIIKMINEYNDSLDVPIIEKITDVELYKALNTPAIHGGLINAKLQGKFSGLVYKLENHISNNNRLKTSEIKDWVKNILSYQDIDYEGSYMKKRKDSRNAIPVNIG